MERMEVEAIWRKIRTANGKVGWVIRHKDPLLVLEVVSLSLLVVSSMESRRVVSIARPGDTPNRIARMLAR